jgi:hypothetical protein
MITSDTVEHPVGNFFSQVELPNKLAMMVPGNVLHEWRPVKPTKEQRHSDNRKRLAEE